MATLEKAPTSNFWSTSLNGAINDSVTTITLNSTVGLQAPGRLVINRQDSTGKNTPSAREVISFTGISGSDLTGVTRGADNSTARSHADGSLVESAIVVGNWDALYKVVNQEHSTSGVHSVADMVTGGSVIDDDTFATASATTLATSESIKAYANNSPNSIARQAIINGNFDVWQRGTSFTPVNASYDVDRFITYFGVDGGTNPTLTASRQSVTPGELDNSKYFYRLTTNGAGSSYGTNAFYVFQQKIENGVRALCGNGKTVTLSFYAKSDIADKKIATYLEQNYGTGGTPTATEAIKGEEFSLTTSWAKYTTTFTTNTLTGKTFGTDGFDKLIATIELMWGATRGTTYHNDSGGAEDFGGAGNIDIAQVQLCAGDVALPFMPKSYEEELRACQRYYWVAINGPASVTGFLGYVRTANSVFVAQVQHPVQMRTAPILEVNSVTDFSISAGASDTTSTGVSITGTQSAIQKTRLSVSFSATIAAGIAGEIYGTSANSRMAFIAEL